MTYKRILNVLAAIWLVSFAGFFIVMYTAEPGDMLGTVLLIVQVACVFLLSCLIAKKKAHSLVLAIPAAALFSYFYLIYIYNAEGRSGSSTDEDDR